MISSARDTPLATLLAWNFRRVFRDASGITYLLAFFTIIAALFPLALGNDSALLHSAGPGIIWVAALLAVNLSPDGIFREDLESGVLEQWIAQPVPAAVIICAKAVVHWFCLGWPVSLLSPALYLLFGETEVSRLLWLAASLLAGTLALSMIAVTVAALTLGSRLVGALSPLLTLPLCVPVLIFGSGALGDSAKMAEGIAGMAAVILLGFPMMLWSGSQALRIALEE